MIHLSNEVLYRLAGLVTWEMGFGEQDVENMSHIRTCERCYRKLCATMAMMDAVDEFGFAEAAAGERNQYGSRKIAARRQETARVEIALTMERFCGTLEVVSAAGGWAFAAPAASMARGDRMVLCPPTRLEDMSDGNAYVELDPRDQRLVIRLAADACQSPRAMLVPPEGPGKSIDLTGRDGYLGAKLPPLAEGRYRLILEK